MPKKTKDAKTYKKSRSLLATKRGRGHIAALAFEADVIQLITDHMEAQGIDENGLAERMQRKPHVVGEYLMGVREIDIKFVADVFFAFGRVVEFSFVPRGEKLVLK